MSDYGIQNRAMLTRLQLPGIQSSRKSREMTDKAAQDNNASVDMVSTTIKLFPANFVKKFDQIKTRIRTEHVFLTLPWYDGGDRILVSDLLDRHRNSMQSMIPELHAEGDWIADNLDALKAAAKDRLGNAYDESMYPSREELRSNLRAKLSYSPIPDARDFRVNLDEETIQYIKGHIESDVAERIQDAMKSVRGRMIDVVEQFIDRVSKIRDLHTNGKVVVEGRVKSSLITNTTKLLEVLPSLNITKDEDVEILGGELRRRLCMYEASTINESPVLRQSVLDQAKRLLARMKQ